MSLFQESSRKPNALNVQTSIESRYCSSLWALLMIGFLAYLILACFSVIDGFGQKVTSTKVKIKVNDELKVPN